jgi:hypothetical protein
MCVTMKPRRNEEAQAHIGLSSHRKKKRKKNSSSSSRHIDWSNGNIHQVFPSNRCFNYLPLVGVEIRSTYLTWIYHFITIKSDKHCFRSHYLQFKWDLILTFILKYEGRSQLREENAFTNGEYGYCRIIAESTFLKLNNCVSGNTHIHFYLLYSHIHFPPL